jgi:glycosyltransferase involved in cell wall biosynthesis
VNQFGKEHFGEELFRNAGLTDTSTLYLLTKDEKTELYKGWIPVIDEELCMNGPLVSVVLPCYNHEKYVARAIESIINQSYKNIELLVCDDCSSDNTPNIMKKYSKYFAKEFYFTENRRGRGWFLAEQASGKYIALAHSDDYWERDKLALQIAYLEKHGGVSLTWAEYVDDEGNIQEDAVFYKKNRSREEWLRHFWEKGNCLCNPSCVMEKDIFLKGHKHGQASKQLPDFFKWIDVVQENEINIIPFPLTKMGVHYSGKSINDSAPTKENVYRSLLEDGVNWLYVLEDMDDKLFIKAFKDKFRNSNACSREELMCERFFLMRDSNSIIRESSAIYYLSKYYVEMSDCLINSYGYKKDDFFTDELKKGFISATELGKQ